jgi:hypothetical protein
MQNLVEMFCGLVDPSIDERGVYPHHALVMSQDDKLTMMALDLFPEQVLRAMVVEILKGAKELIYGLDRTCLDGQGTTLGDCVAGVYWNGTEFKPFIIEYQHSPRIVKEINWDNEFWTSALQGEIAFLQSRSQKS